MLVFLLLYNLAAKKNFVVNTLSTDIKKLLLLQVPLNGVENTDRAATTAESFFPFNFSPEVWKLTLIGFDAQTLIYDLQYCLRVITVLLLCFFGGGLLSVFFFAIAGQL